MRAEQLRDVTAPKLISANNNNNIYNLPVYLIQRLFSNNHGSENICSHISILMELVCLLELGIEARIVLVLTRTSARPEVRGTADVGWRSLNPLPINPPRTHSRLYHHMCLRTDGR